MSEYLPVNHGLSEQAAAELNKVFAIYDKHISRVCELQELLEEEEKQASYWLKKLSQLDPDSKLLEQWLYRLDMNSCRVT